MDHIFYTFLTVFGIGLVIFVHELGHFMAARAVGVRVEAFSIGFGPKLIAFTRGPTEYKLCAVPLGGYVKMAGEDPTRPTSGDPEEFGSKNVWQRMLVIVAGVIMNVLFALVCIPIAFSAGVNVEAPLIGGTVPDSPAEAAGIFAGDTIIAVNDRPVLMFDDARLDIAVASGPVKLTLERGGKRFDKTLTPVESAAGFRQAGLRPRIDSVEVTAAALSPDKAEDPGHRLLAERLAAAGLVANDRILALNGLPIEYESAWTADVRIGTKVRLLVERDGERRTVEYEPVEYLDPDPSARAFVIGTVLTPATLEIRTVASHSLADRLGLRAGDVLVRINATDLAKDRRNLAELLGDGTDVRRVAELTPEAAPPFAAALAMTVLRDGQEVALSIDAPTFDARREVLRSFHIVRRGCVISEVLPDSPAAEAGILAGDQVLEADGAEVKEPGDFISRILKSKGNAVSIKVRRGESDVELSVTPNNQRPIPLVLDGIRFDTPKATVSFPFGMESLKAGAVYCVRSVVRIAQTLKSLLTGTVSAKNVSGPIGIFEASYHFLDYGIMRGLLFLCVVSLNLALLNILPIPILDGGWLMFLIYEKITGRPPSARFVGIAQWIGLAMILSLVLFATWNDVSRLWDRYISKWF